MAYSFAQLEGLWIQAGGSRALAPVMAAIALAESRGNPDATGKAAGEKGLWQINPKVWGSLATYDPLGNARAAVHVEASQGLSAWTTYTSGAYRKYLGSAAPQNAPTGTGQASGTTTAGGRGSAGVSGTPAAPNSASSSSGSGSSGGLWGWIQAVWTGIEVGSAQTQIGQDTGAVANLASTFGGLGAIAQSIVGLSGPFVKAGEALDWFFVPSHWVRLLSGVGGGVLVLLGLYSFSHIGGAPNLSVEGVSIPEPSGDMALAIGVGEVGLGAVLLFVAFHNVPSSVTTFGEFLGFLQGKASTAVSATTSPASAATTAASTGGG